MIRSRVIITAVLFILLSCESKEKSVVIVENGNLFLKTYDNEKLISVSKLNEDSVKHGETEVFDSVGNVVQRIYYKLGLKDSIEITYYQSGDVKQVTKWDQGKKFSVEVDYYDGIREEYFEIEEGDTFKITEPLTKAYRYHDFEEQVVYERTFNEKGDLVSEKGSVIAIKGYSGLKFDKGDTLKLQYYVVDPDWVDHKFVVNFSDDNGKLIRSDSLEMNEDYSAFFHIIVLPEEGLFKVEAICTMSDQLFDNHKTDTSTLDIQVGNFKRI